MPVEFWLTADAKTTFMVVRTSVNGSMRSFSEELVTFVQEQGFANVAIVTSTANPVSRERQTNR